MAGENLMDASAGIDTNLYREPIGVFAGIVPFNFPAMIPMGWMAPLCVASGNTMVIKAASMTPMTCMEITKLYQEAGVPDGVINVVTCSRNEADILLTHPDVNGVSFVGSTSVGLHVYSKAAAHGKRVQALCEAKTMPRCWPMRQLTVPQRGLSTPRLVARANAAWRCRLSWCRKRSLIS